MNKRIFLIFLLFDLKINLHSSVADAFSDKARGQTIFSILKSPVSPYFYSFGGAGSAMLVEDNIFLNPAAMYTYYANSFFIGFQKNNVNSYQTDLAFLIRNEYILKGFSLSYLDYGDFIKIDEFGNINGKFSPYDFIFSYSYGWGRRERFGVKIKYIESNLVYDKIRGLAFDGGFYVKGKKSGLSIIIRNIGPSSKSGNRYYSLPLEIATGFDYIYSNTIRGVFELKFPIDNKTYAVGGVEYKFIYKDTTFNFRIGANTINFRELGWTGIFTGGFDISVGGFGIEYCFFPYSNIDNTHRVMIKYRFGDVKFKKEEEYIFKEFIAKEISLKKKIVVFGFNNDDVNYSNIIADSIEERLIEKNHAVISRLDPLYISNAKSLFTEQYNVIETAKSIGADYAVWGNIIKRDEIKAEFNMVVFSIKDGKSKEYSLISNIYDIRNIALKLADEISVFISGE
ncbi:MAG: hypothetical protein N2Z20_05325 [Elusimicrobiales bacterium]|nr:hypothetical protein [Elusimicrobiales bacterium]